VEAMARRRTRLHVRCKVARWGCDFVGQWPRRHRVCDPPLGETFVRIPLGDSVIVDPALAVPPRWIVSRIFFATRVGNRSENCGRGTVACWAARPYWSVRFSTAIAMMTRLRDYGW